MPNLGQLRVMTFGRQCCGDWMKSVLHGGAALVWFDGALLAGLAILAVAFPASIHCLFITCETGVPAHSNEESPMNTHPYLRAFLAGIFVPTLVLPVMLVGFITLRLCWRSLCLLSVSLFFRWRLCRRCSELWNVLYWRRIERTHMALGAHGAILPFLGAPTGAFVASSLGMLQDWHTRDRVVSDVPDPLCISRRHFCGGGGGVLPGWKYIVGFLNGWLGLRKSCLLASSS